MSQRTTTVRATVLQAAGLEEGGDRRFAIGAFHRLRVLEDIISTTFSGRANLLRALHPYGLAFVTSNRAGGVTRSRSRLAGGHEAGESEDASEE